MVHRHALGAALAAIRPPAPKESGRRTLGGQPLLVKKQVVLTGDRLTDAQPGFDNQTRNRPST